MLWHSLPPAKLLKIKPRYLLTQVHNVFDQLRGAAVFTNMDIRSGYWQLLVDDESIPKTAFVCHRGPFKFLKMPFSLANTPSMYHEPSASQLCGKMCDGFY